MRSERDPNEQRQAEREPVGGLSPTPWPRERCFHQAVTVPFSFPLLYTRDVFHPENPTLEKAFRVETDDETLVRRVLVAIDAGVWNAWPKLWPMIARRLETIGGIDAVADPVIVPGGEAAKEGLGIVEQVAGLCAAHRIDRQSYLLALGGGAMLDAVGLAAALVHRGVRLVRMPTTVLAQNDAGIGVKNGVNACGQKNMLGCFAPPWAVVSDLNFLRTLGAREWRAGLSEAVKVACIKDAAFFAYLEESAAALARRDEEAMAEAVWRCAQLHAAHTRGSGDPFETGSARPLDFGHWAAHWLEMRTAGAVNHGEAVAIGIAADATYAERLAFCPPGTARRVCACLEAMGFDLWHPMLTEYDPQGEPAVFRGLDQFREHLGGRLTLTLPAPLGGRVEVHEVDRAQMRGAIRSLRR